MISRDGLKGVSLFKELSNEDFSRIADIAREVSFRDGELLFREGEPARHCFFISRGAVDIVKGLGTAQEQKLATLGTGEFFGEMAILEDRERSATARATGVCRALAVSKEDLEDVFQNHPRIAARIHAAVIRRHAANVSTYLRNPGNE